MRHVEPKAYRQQRASDSPPPLSPSLHRMEKERQDGPSHVLKAKSLTEAGCDQCIEATERYNGVDHALRDSLRAHTGDNRLPKIARPAGIIGGGRELAGRTSRTQRRVQEGLTAFGVATKKKGWEASTKRAEKRYDKIEVGVRFLMFHERAGQGTGRRYRDPPTQDGGGRSRGDGPRPGKGERTARMEERIRGGQKTRAGRCVHTNKRCQSRTCLVRRPACSRLLSSRALMPPDTCAAAHCCICVFYTVERKNHSAALAPRLLEPHHSAAWVASCALQFLQQHHSENSVRQLFFRPPTTPRRGVPVRPHRVGGASHLTCKDQLDLRFNSKMKCLWRVCVCLRV